MLINLGQVDWSDFEEVKNLAIRLGGKTPQAVIQNSDGTYRLTHGDRSSLLRSIYRSGGKIVFNTIARPGVDQETC